jgi:hypothetical protein
LLRGTGDKLDVLILDAEKTASVTNRQSGSFDFDLEAVEFSVVRTEDGGIRLIANQVITVLVVENLSNPGAQIVSVTNGEAAGLFGQIVQPIICEGGRPR